MSKQIQSSQKDQKEALSQYNVLAEEESYANLLVKQLQKPDPIGYPKSLTHHGKAPKPTKQTSLAKRLSLFMQCYEYLQKNHQRILTYPNYQEAPNLLAFSFNNLKSGTVCILELNLKNPKAHLRMRYLTPKHNNKNNLQSLYIESILTITKFKAYV